MISVSFLEGPLVDDDDGGGDDGGADDVVVVDLLASMMVLLEAAEFEQRLPANYLRSLNPQHQQQLWRPPQNLAPMMEEAVDDDVILEEGVMILAEAVDSTLMEDVVRLLVERMETKEVVEDLLQFRYLRQ